MAQYIEDIGGLSLIKQTKVLSTGVAVDFSNATSVALPAATTFGSGVGSINVTSASANALTVVPNGTTNPTLQVNAATTSAVNGILITGSAAGSKAAIAVISSNATEGLTIDAKGNQSISFNTVGGSGAIVMGQQVTMTDAKNINVGSTTGTKIGTATTQKLAFYNSTPVVQQATTGTTTGFTASTGTTVVSGSTFTGNTGSTAYTIGDIVLALKNLGLLAA